MTSPARTPEPERREAPERPEPDERALVEGLRAGDPAAFDRAYAAHRPRVHAFLLRLSGRRDLADDLFQETFLRLARHALRLRPDTDLRAWLFTVAANLHRNHRRFLLFDGERLRALRLADRAGRPEAASPEADAVASQRLAHLEVALAALPAHHREVLLLVGVEGFTPDEAAAVLGLRGDALRKRLSRARAALAVAYDTGILHIQGPAR